MKECNKGTSIGCVIGVATGLVFSVIVTECAGVIDVSLYSIYMESSQFRGS